MVIDCTQQDGTCVLFDDKYNEPPSTGDYIPANDTSIQLTSFKSSGTTEDEVLSIQVNVCKSVYDIQSIEIYMLNQDKSSTQSDMRLVVELLENDTPIMYNHCSLASHCKLDGTSYTKDKGKITVYRFDLNQLNLTKFIHRSQTIRIKCLSNAMVVSSGNPVTLRTYNVGDWVIGLYQLIPLDDSNYIINGKQFDIMKTSSGNYYNVQSNKYLQESSDRKETFTIIRCDDKGNDLTDVEDVKYKDFVKFKITPSKTETETETKTFLKATIKEQLGFGDCSFGDW